MNRSNQVELVGVTRDYQMGEVTVTAVDGLTLDIAQGEFVVLLGPSGSGKTTTLNLIGGLDQPTSGEIRVEGEAINTYSDRELTRYRRNKVGFIFQFFNLIPTLTAAENIAFALNLTRTNGADLDRQSRELLGLVGLSGRADHFPAQLSGGEQQRVAIARALATSNPVLLCDEPTGELDFQTGIQILELLQAHAVDGRAVLAVTHNREISRIADRVIELSSGRVVSDGPPRGGKADVVDLHW